MGASLSFPTVAFESGMWVRFGAAADFVALLVAVWLGSFARGEAQRQL